MTAATVVEADPGAARYRSAVVAYLVAGTLPAIVVAAALGLVVSSSCGDGVDCSFGIELFVFGGGYLAFGLAVAGPLAVNHRLRRLGAPRAARTGWLCVALLPLALLGLGIPLVPVLARWLALRGHVPEVAPALEPGTVRPAPPTPVAPAPVAGNPVLRSDPTERIAAALPGFLAGFEAANGHPPGDGNELVPAAQGADAVGSGVLAALEPVPPQVASFFARFERLWLPDLHVGTRVGPPFWIAAQHADGRPIVVGLDGRSVEVLAVGIDGSGRLLVVDRVGGAVLLLPDGVVDRNGFRPAGGQPLTRAEVTVAPDLDRFLVTIAVDLEAAAGA